MDTTALPSSASAHHAAAPAPVANADAKPAAPASAPLANPPTTFDVVKSEGNAHFTAGRYETAIALYARCIALDPTRWEAYSNRAQAAIKLKRWAEALANAEAGLRLAPTNKKLLGSRTIAAAWLYSTASSASDRARYFALHRSAPLDHRLWMQRVPIAGCGFGYRALRDIPQGAYILRDEAVSSKPFPAGEARSAEHVRPLVEYLLKRPSLLASLTFAPNQLALAASLQKPLSLSCTEAEWRDAAAKALSNSFVEAAPNASSPSSEPLSVFTFHPLSSYFNHSCWPNCAGDGAEIFALKTVAAGSELTINYATRLQYETRAHRQRELSNSFGFECRCTRCQGTEAADVEAKLTEFESKLTPQQRKEIGAQIGSLMRGVDELSSGLSLQSWLSGVESFLSSPLLGPHHRFKLQLLLCIPALCDGPLGSLIPRATAVDLLRRLIRANAALLPELHPAKQSAMLSWMEAVAAGGVRVDAKELLKLDPAAQQLILEKNLLHD